MFTTVAAIQMNSGNDVKKNLQQAEILIKQSAQQGASLIVLPEMFAMMGANETDKVRIAESIGKGLIQDFLAAQALTHNVWLVGGTIPLLTDDPTKVAAACLIYNPQGQIAARYDKIHLFDVQVDSLHYAESTTTQPGTETIVVDTSIGKLGVCVCYDIRFPELARRLVDQGAEIIAVPTAFTQTTGAAHWDILIRALAIQTQCFVIAACAVGKHPSGRITYGHSVIIDPWGTVLTSLEDNIGSINAAIDLTQIATVRKNMPIQRHRRLSI